MSVTETSLPMCENCYARCIEKNVVWEPDTPRTDLLRAMRARKAGVSSLEVPPQATVSKPKGKT